MSLFEFLNEQSAGRLLFYGIIFTITVYYVMQGLIYIFGHIFKR